jgi:uncharacterized protein (DUF983 family)
VGAGFGVQPLHPCIISLRFRPVSTQIRTPESTLRRAARYAGRALLRHCPNCGGRRIWNNWLTMKEACPDCGLHLERGEHGYIVGSYMFNIVASELVFAALFIGIVVGTWPSPPWTWLQWGGGILMLLMPVLFYPFSKTLFLAFDLMFRPQNFEADDRLRGGGNRR